VPFWLAGFWLARDVYRTAFVATQLRVQRAAWSLTTVAMGRVLSTLGGFTADLDGAKAAVAMTVNDAPMECVELAVGVDAHRFGTGLSSSEVSWIVSEVNSYLADASSPNADA
jgi:hypothetical protein